MGSKKARKIETEAPVPRPLSAEGFHTLDQIRRLLWREDLNQHRRMPEGLNNIRFIDASRQYAKVLYALYHVSGPKLKEHKPAVVEVPKELFKEIMKGAPGSGFYKTGTNVIVISSEVLEEEYDSQYRLNEYFTHELMHYALHAANGSISIIVNEKGRESAKWLPNFLWEGMTSYMTGILTNDTDRDLPLSYPHETAALVLLEKIAGRDTLMESIKSGDWRGVQQIFESKYGKNAFLNLLKAKTGAEAYHNIISKDINRRKPTINLQELQRDPVYRRTRILLRSEEEKKRRWKGLVPSKVQ